MKLAVVEMALVYSSSLKLYVLCGIEAIWTILV